MTSSPRRVFRYARLDRAANSCAALVAALAISMPQRAVAQSVDASVLAQRSFPSVVLVTVRDRDGQALALGSGFAVAPGVVATNRHVLAGGASASVKPVGGGATYNAIGVSAVDDQHDLALLTVPDLRVPALGLRSDPKPAIGERVYAIGNPRGLEGTFSDGIVSGLRFLGPDSLLQITAPISPGSSGGPVLSASGHVIGVAVASIEGGQSLNFAVPAQFLERLLSRQSVPRAVSSISTSRRPSSPAGGRGSPSGTEGVVLGSFQWSPSRGDGTAEFSFSIRNKLDRTVKQPTYIIVFYDRDGEPLDAIEKTFLGEIRAGLAWRETGWVDGSVRRLVSRIAFRVLDYEVRN